MEYISLKAKNYSDKQFTQKFDQIFKNIKINPFIFVINERMLHFPEQIASPAFQSLW